MTMTMPVSASVTAREPLWAREEKAALRFFALHPSKRMVTVHEDIMRTVTGTASERECWCGILDSCDRVWTQVSPDGDIITTREKPSAPVFLLEETLIRGLSGASRGAASVLSHRDDADGEDSVNVGAGAVRSEHDTALLRALASLASRVTSSWTGITRRSHEHDDVHGLVTNTGVVFSADTDIMSTMNQSAGHISERMEYGLLSYRELGALYGYPPSAVRFFDRMNQKIADYLRDHPGEDAASPAVRSMFNSADRVRCQYGRDDSHIQFVTGRGLVDDAREELDAMYGDDDRDGGEFTWAPFVLGEDD